MKLMEIEKTFLTQSLENVAEELLHRASQLEDALKNSSMRAEAERLWFGEPRPEQIARLRAAARQIESRLSEED